MKSPDIIDAIRPIIKAFDTLGILYYIGGSIASSAYGLARATLDVDMILSKLEWFRLGGEISEKQWNDILGVMKVQGSLLDKEYLYRWAKELGVDGLLKKAFDEAEGRGRGEG